MKTSLLFGFILLYALSVTVDAAKGGLSKDEQKKLLDEINKDRKKFNSQFKDLTYDTELEKKAAEFNCKKRGLIWLQWNSVQEDVLNAGGPRYNPYAEFFSAKNEKIGCSKEIRCSEIMDKELGEKFNGKEMVRLGGCVVDPHDHQLFENKIDKSLIPKGGKYGDLLGIKMSSSGKVFNLIVFIAIMVFNF
ncbi:hypothetical protein CRE_05874 [Caenorhabditis remanei]|uniref:SCP domain-containing protein n=1 Tax=Caenorhabditis remanei TaxID=31234 RepID=E3MNI5_CAERE|nr:hypothetical protein CRE_05874 [Caenorhabditis remanei]